MFVFAFVLNASVPQFKLFVPNALPQAPRDITVALGVDSQTMGDMQMS